MWGLVLQTWNEVTFWDMYFSFSKNLTQVRSSQSAFSLQLLSILTITSLLFTSLEIFEISSYISVFCQKTKKTNLLHTISTKVKSFLIFIHLETQTSLTIRLLHSHPITWIVTFQVFYVNEPSIRLTLKVFQPIHIPI